MDSNSKLSINELAAEPSASSFADRNKKEDEDLLGSTHPLWISRTKCFSAYVCLIMSFSTILRFTFSLGLYGGAIFIPYIIFRIAVAMPVLLVEVMLGRYVTGSFIKVYLMCPFYEGIFACQFMSTGFVVFSKFAVLVRLFKYTASLFRGRIAWQHCEKPWAQINCYERFDNTTALLKCLHYYNKSFCEHLHWETSGRQYWKNIVINTTDPGTMGFSISYLIVAIAAIIIFNYKGIRGLEKALLIFSAVPVILMSCVNLVTFLTPGSVTGFRIIWKMDPTLLGDPEIWVSALSDTVITLCFGMFALPFISSHGNFTDDILYDVLTIICTEMLCFIFAIPILSIIKTLNEDVPFFKDDYDVYVWISEAFIFYPYPKELWAFIFYLGVSLLELSSQTILCMSIFEAAAGLFKDRFSFSYLLIMLGMALFLFSLPLIFFPYLLANGIADILLTVVFLQLSTLIIFYGIRRFNDDFHFMMGYHPSFFFSCTIVSSTILTLIFLPLTTLTKAANDSWKYGDYALLGITMTTFILAAIIQIIKAYKKGNWLLAILENSDWGPSLPLLKSSRIVFDSKTITKEYMYRQELNKKPLMKPNEFSEQNIVHLV